MPNKVFKFLTFLIVISSTSFLFGQSFTLSGKIKDFGTKAPIEGVNITIQGTNQGITSNKAGYYKIDVQKGDVIVFSHVGYKSINYKVEKNVVYNVELKTEKYILNDVMVQSSRYENSALKIDAPVKDIPLTVNIVDSKVLEERNIVDMNDAVKNINGVRPINRYGGFQTFMFRGFNDFVMMIDGVRDERHNHSSSAPQSNLSNVERIEVIKGPQSVMYGHSALGGIINVIRKSPTLQNKYNFSASYGSFDSKKIIAGAGGPITKNLLYRLDFGITDRSGWRKFGQKTANAYLALKWLPSESDHFEVQIAVNDDKYDTDTGVPVDENNKIPSTVDRKTRFNDPVDFLKHKRYDFQINYTKDLSEKSFIRNKISYYFDDIDYFSTESLSYNEARDSVKRSYPFYFNHQAYPFQNQLEYGSSYNFANMENKILIGYSLGILHRKTYRGDIFGEGKFTTIAVKNPVLNQGYIDYVDTKYQGKDEIYHGFYLQDWLKINSNFKLLFGLRYDIFRGTYYVDKVNEDREVIEEGKKTDINKNSFTYRLGSIYDFNDSFSLYGSYSTYFKPSRRIGDKGEIFDPEKGYQGELGLRYIYNDNLKLNLAGYYIIKNDIVEYLGKDADNNRIYEQVGEVESKGLEFDLNYLIDNSVTLNLGYGYNNTEYLEFKNDLQNKYKGNKLRYAPEHMLKIWGDWLINKNFGVTVGMNYMAENFTNLQNTYKLPAYTTVDCSAYLKLNSSEIRFFVNNLFDEEYFTDAIMSNQFFPGPERNFTIMFRIYN